MNLKVRNIRIPLGFDIINNKVQTILNGMFFGIGYNVLSKRSMELYPMYCMHIGLSSSKDFIDPNISGAIQYYMGLINEFSLNLEYSFGESKRAYVLLRSGYIIPAKTSWTRLTGDSNYINGMYYAGREPVDESALSYKLDIMNSFFLGIGIGINYLSPEYR